MFFNYQQQSKYISFFSLSHLLEKQFSYNYIYYFFFPELENDFDLYYSKNNLVFDPFLEHIFDLNYLRLSDESEGYSIYDIDNIASNPITYNFNKNLFLPWQFFIFISSDNPESYLYKTNFFYFYFFSRSFEQTNCFFDLDEDPYFNFGKWLFNFFADRSSLLDNFWADESILYELFSNEEFLQETWLLECFFSSQFILFFDPLDRIFLWQNLQQHQRFLIFFFDTIFKNMLPEEFFNQHRNQIFESSSPFWSSLRYNLENFTGEKWLFFSMVELENFKEFTFPFDSFFFLEIDRIYFDIFIHFWFFNKKLKYNDRIFFRFCKNLTISKKLLKRI